MKNLKSSEIPEYMKLKYDYPFKKLFGYEGNEEITKDLISSIIGEEIKTLEFKNPYLIGEMRTDKEEVLDIKAELNGDVLCDIEIQVANEHDIIKRVLDYWAKMYRSSIGKNRKYINMKRTIVILITTFNVDELKGIEEYSATWKIIEEKYKIQLTDMLEIDIIELPKAEKEIKKGTFKRNKKNDWIKFVINPKKMKEEHMDDLDKRIEEAYEKWQQEGWTEEEKDILERKYLDLESQRYGREYEKKLGREEGRAEGRAEGRVEGRIEGKKEIARNLLKEGSDTKFISKVTGLSEEEIERLNNDEKNSD